jgi:hypothetical protein
MSIDKHLYLQEMDRLLAAAKARLLAQSPDVELYTISIWTDPKAAVSAVSFDTRDNSDERVQRSNEWSMSHYDEYMAEGDEELAALFRPTEGRNQNPADFQFNKIATVEHRSFIAEDRPIAIVGDTPPDSPLWPTLELLLSIVQKHAHGLYRDLRLHADARIAINSPRSWYDHEIPLTD